MNVGGKISWTLAGRTYNGVVRTTCSHGQDPQPQDGDFVLLNIEGLDIAIKDVTSVPYEKS